MKSFIGWLLVILIIAGGAGLALSHFHTTTRQQAYDLELAALQENFQTASVGLQLLDEESYRKEIGIHLTRYFSKLAKLAKDYPEFYDIEREKKIGEERLAKGRMTEANKLARDERIDITLDLFNKMRSGQYRTLYTKADKTFRFDIYDITPAKVASESRVKFSHVHWGAFGKVNYKSIIGNIRAKQEKDKPVEIPQIIGEGQPPALQIEPQRWVKEFPPGLEIGYYDLPQFPQVAESIELIFMFGMRTVGGTEITANITFEDIPIPEAWKVPEGQKWEAHERFADQDELEAAGAEAKPTIK